ncbi:predicted protein [Nematostella vectensis]|uniref:DNA helicase n=1 Tax=Nematostella vectensis TaxID=45351 RepID=A7SCY5_NEMVE|nr:predicted protein [Nematostella vectensis]|eukprot:XP_001630460.1 predicted protein [Nematostella vectensis]
MLNSIRWRSLLSSSHYREFLVAIAIDEAHCISQWGIQSKPTTTPFRTWYGHLGEILSLVSTPTITLTDTASKATKKNIFKVLNLSNNTFAIERSRQRQESEPTMRREMSANEIRYYGVTRRREREIIFCHAGFFGLFGSLHKDLGGKCEVLGLSEVRDTVAGKTLVGYESLLPYINRPPSLNKPNKIRTEDSFTTRYSEISEDQGHKRKNLSPISNTPTFTHSIRFIYILSSFLDTKVLKSNKVEVEVDSITPSIRRGIKKANNEYAEKAMQTKQPQEQEQPQHPLQQPEQPQDQEQPQHPLQQPEQPQEQELPQEVLDDIIFIPAGLELVEKDDFIHFVSERQEDLTFLN